jgi:hypothetical protein
VHQRPFGGAFSLPHHTPVNLSPDTLTYLNQRANSYNGTVDNILAITPSYLDTDQEVLAFWQDRDLSHILCQSDHPELTDSWSNIIPEDASSNRGRGGHDMTPLDVLNTYADNALDALSVELHQP